MNLTIPIRAHNSTVSQFRQLRRSDSLKRTKGGRKRYISSMIATTLLVGAFVTAGVGGVPQSVAAQASPNPQNYNSSPDSNRKPGTSKDTSPPAENTTPTPPPATDPSSTQTSPPATPSTSPEPTPAPATAQEAPASTFMTTPQIVTPSASSRRADSAAAIANMTAAQSNQGSQSVEYTSGSLSDETRNHIFMFAGIVAAVGVLLYAVSFIGTSVPVSKNEIPVRYIASVKEVITH